MLKLIKYEYRKDMIMYIIIFGLLFVLETYLAMSVLAESPTNVVISVLLYMLMGWAVIVAIMIMGVVSYARELGAKYSYMTFMTPNSTYKIVGAKYLTLLVTTVAATVLYGFFIYLDIKLILWKFDEVADVLEMIDDVLEIIVGKNIGNYVMGLAAIVIGLWMTVLLTVSFAYLAITLSNTVLANKRGKGWLAVGFFVAIRVAVQVITNYLPRFDYGTDTILQIMAGSWLTYIFDVIFIVGTYFGVSELLKHKVSL